MKTKIFKDAPTDVVVSQTQPVRIRYAAVSRNLTPHFLRLCPRKGAVKGRFRPPFYPYRRRAVRLVAPAPGPLLRLPLQAMLI
jgi:hypothetical protein